MVLPGVLTEVRDDGVHHDQEVDDELNYNGWVRILVGSNQIGFLERQHGVKSVLDNLLELHAVVGSGDLLDDRGELVSHDLVPNSFMGLRIKVDAFRRDVFLDPAFEHEELQDGSVGNSPVEVSIVEGVSTISESNSK